MTMAAGVKRNELQSDSVEVLAIAHLMEILGEAANAVSGQLKTRYSGVPWRQMVNAHNRIIHGYYNIDLNVLRRIVTDELPRDAAQIDHIIVAEGY